MGLEILKNGAEMRRFGVVGLKEIYRLVRNHPVLVGCLIWFVFLYRNFPFLFSLSVSAFPVLVCTAVLLGTLLSLGQSENDEIGEEHEKVGLGFEGSNLRKGWSESVDFVERDESFDGDDGYVEEKVELVEKGFEGELLADDVKRVDEIGQDHGLGYGSVSPIDLDVRDIVLEKRLREEMDGEGEKLGVIEEVEEDGDEETEDLERDRSLGGSMEAEDSGSYRSLGGSVDAAADDQFDSLLMSWKRVDADGEHDENDADDESCESRSDGAESSSPDASMADIVPLLDELNPLLESGNSQQVDPSDEAFALPPEEFIGSCESSVHSDVEAGDLEVEEDRAGDEDNEDDDDDDEGAQKIKVDTTTSAITWTEDDQKNLMELDISELERNRRLENLIARRRARRNLGMMMERNLIDLDGMDVFQVAPISTRRRNPFDLSHDSDYGMGLPPIPGSAPSALQPRHNPFDLPYDSSEEKPDLRGDGFQEEFMEFSHVPKEPIFRRNETFSVGSSSMEFPRYEGRDTSHSSRFRPYFVTEGTTREGTNYSFQRLPSDVSESKLSSVAETESTSAVDEDEIKRIDHDEMADDTDIVSHVDQVSFLAKQRGILSEDVDSISGNQHEYENRAFDRILPEIELGSGHHGSESDTDEAASLLNTGLRDTESCAEADLLLPEEAHLVIPAEIDTSNAYSRKEKQDQNNSSSSLSSLSEEYNVIKGVEEDESLTNVEQTPSNFTESLDIPSEHFIHATDSEHASDTEDDGHIKDPVYDSSPRGVKSRSSSFSSDLPRDASIDSIQLVHVQIDPSGSEESKVPDEVPERDASVDFIQLLNEQNNILGSVELDVPGEVSEEGPPGQSEVANPGLGELIDSEDHAFIKDEFFWSDEDLGDVKESSTPENVIHLDSSFSHTGVEKEAVVLEDKVLNSQGDRATSYDAVKDTSLEEQEADKGFLDMSTNHELKPLEGVNMTELVDIQTSVSETMLSDEEAKIDEGQQQDVKIPVSSSYSDRTVDTPDNTDGTLVSIVDERDSFADESLITTTHGKHEEEEATIMTRKHEDENENEIGAISVDESEKCSGLQEPEHFFYSEKSGSTEHTGTEERGDDPIVGNNDTPESILEGPESGIVRPAVMIIDVVGADETMHCDTSDTKGIDEELLLELEAVGDFSMPLDLNHKGIYTCLHEDFPGMIEPDMSEVKASADVPPVDATSHGDDADVEKHDPLDERNDKNLSTLPEPVLQETIKDNRFTETLVSDMRTESTVYNPVSEQIEETVTIIHNGDETGLRHPESDQSRKDESMSELALHDARSLASEQNHDTPETHFTEGNIDVAVDKNLPILG